MNGHGCSEFSADESGRILDRIAGLEKVIPPSAVAKALERTGKKDNRNCRLTSEVMIWVVTAMGLFTEMPIRQVFKACRRFRKDETSPARSSLCMARQRLGSAPLAELHRLVVKPIATEGTPNAFYRGMRKLTIDGTVLDAPDCPAHQDLGRSSGSRGPGCFPLLRKVSLMEVGTHVELAFVHGGWKDSERTIVEPLWESIPDDSLLIEDRGLYSFSSFSKLNEKCKLLVRITKSMAFNHREALPDGSFLTKIYKAHWYRTNDKGGVPVRVIEYKLNDPQRVGHDQVHRLMTNLLDAEKYPAEELIAEYHERWEGELVFDEQKTHQDPCRAEKTTNLRSQTADGIKQELYALSLAHFVVRYLMHHAAIEAGVDVDRLSFRGSFQILKTRLPECTATQPRGLLQWFQNLISELAQERIEARRNRINPRVIKRKMSRWPKCRPKHRGIPTLTQTFVQSIVMIH